MADYSRQYASFRSNIPQKKVSISRSVTWTLYDAGSRDVLSPIIFLPPSCGQADVFFQQLLSLSAFGYRAIAVDYPVCWSIKSFCVFFHHLLDALHLTQVHLFGSGLGGFLALKYAEHSRGNRRVVSIVLCNSYTDSSFFSPHFPSLPPTLFWLLPAVVLRRAINRDLSKSCHDASITASYHFTNISLENLQQSELSSRLTLQRCVDYVQPQYLKHVNIMVVETLDSPLQGSGAAEEMDKCFPSSRKALLKDGGLYPFLSRPQHLHLFVQIHLKQFLTHPSCPLSPSSSLYKLSQLAKQQPQLLQQNDSHEKKFVVSTNTTTTTTTAT